MNVWGIIIVCIGAAIVVGTVVALLLPQKDGSLKTTTQAKLTAKATVTPPEEAEDASP